MQLGVVVVLSLFLSARGAESESAQGIVPAQEANKSCEGEIQRQGVRMLYSSRQHHGLLARRQGPVEIGERKLTEGCIAAGKGTRPDRLRTRRMLSEVVESDGLLGVVESA